MGRRPPSGCSTDDLKSSPLVRRFASQIVDGARGMPILDVACGSGRNALVLSQLNAEVICIDKDLRRLQAHQSNLDSARLKLIPLDLIKDSWPFGSGSVGGIINVHFLLPSLFPFFKMSLSPGGCLLIETVPGCGGNYLQLPKAGELRSLFAGDFDFVF